MGDDPASFWVVVIFAGQTLCVFWCICVFCSTASFARYACTIYASFSMAPTLNLKILEKSWHVTMEKNQKQHKTTPCLSECMSLLNMVVFNQPCHCENRDFYHRTTSNKHVFLHIQTWECRRCSIHSWPMEGDFDSRQQHPKRHRESHRPPATYLISSQRHWT